MVLLAEYALTPDVFDSTCHSNAEVCGFHLQLLKDVLLHEGLVRNLRNGEWTDLFVRNRRPWHPRAKELLKKLATQKRLAAFPPVRSGTPGSDAEWCDEALATHQVLQLSGIIVTDAIADGYAQEPVVAPLHRLSSAAWWTSRSSSIRLRRTLADYLAALALVLRHANHIMFIDPHVDPGLVHYRDFAALVQAAGGRSPVPLVEIHRVAWLGSSRDRRPRCDELEGSFRQALAGPIRTAGLKLDVFLWDDFHDRYVISNLVGIQMGNGFDTTAAPRELTTWSRLGRNVRDDVQREFDVASRRHTLRRRFAIP